LSQQRFGRRTPMAPEELAEEFQMEQQQDVS
jgi:hypothetical protein